MYAKDSLYGKLNSLMEQYSDPRTKDYLLVDSPYPMLLMIGIYLWFCLKAGPILMKGREPYKLNKTIRYYNIMQVILNVFLFSKAIYTATFGFSTSHLACMPFDDSINKYTIGYCECVHMYYLIKLTELLDTVFFILRKKFSQVSFLHVYHHSLLAIFSWIFVKFAPVGHVYFLGFINTFIHIVMYSYYLMASYGQKFKKYLWWKRYLTIAQMVQFLMIMLHALQALLLGCNYPTFILILITLQGLIFTYLFGKFYVDAYVKPKKLSKKNF